MTWPAPKRVDHDLQVMIDGILGGILGEIVGRVGVRGLASPR